MTPTIKQPLFVVTGASCVGKTTLCEILFQNERDYVVMEGDLLWCKIYDTTEDGYRDFRRTWMRLSASISQISKPVVLCGCGVPEQFESQPERELFTNIHYLAAVCDEDELIRRMKVGRGVTDEGWIKSSVDFNRWLQENHDKTSPEITLLDTTHLIPTEAAEAAHKWITSKI